MKLTFTIAKKYLSEKDISIRKTDYGEYRVTFMRVSVKEAEDAAYYTNNLEDAIRTGAHMSEKRYELYPRMWRR